VAAAVEKRGGGGPRAQEMARILLFYG